MTDTNPHNFPGMREFLARDFTARREAALASWRAALGSEAPKVLAAWAEAVREDEARDAHARALAEAAHAEAQRHHRRTVEIPEAFLAGGAAPRDVRMWLSGPRLETKAASATREWLKVDQEPFLVLVGDVGGGKTAGATLELMDAALESPRWASKDAPRVWLVPEVALGCMLGRAGEELLAAATTASVLTLEDLGAEAMVGADVWLALLGVVIDARYRSEARTIITTNLTTDALRVRYKDRIVDRLRQCAQFTQCDSNSFRKRAP